MVFVLSLLLFFRSNVLQKILNFKLFGYETLKVIAENASDVHYLTASYFLYRETRQHGDT